MYVYIFYLLLLLHLFHKLLIPLLLPLFHQKVPFVDFPFQRYFRLISPSLLFFPIMVKFHRYVAFTDDSWNYNSTQYQIGD